MFCGRWPRLLGGCGRCCCGRDAGLGWPFRGGDAAGRDTLPGAGVELRAGPTFGRGAGSGAALRACVGAGRGAGSGGALRCAEAFCRMVRVLTGSGAGLLWVGRGRGALDVCTGTIPRSVESARGTSPVIKRVPETEMVLISRMRVTHTMMATNIGTARISRFGSIMLVLAML